MKVVKKTLTILLSVILWAVILVAALFTFTTMATKDSTRVASIGGFTPLTVQTDSMAPTFYSGDMIIIKKVDPASLKVGDIITFHTIIENQYVLNTHRIAVIDEENGYRRYTTKGDNNSVSDQHIIADGDIVGKYAGKVSKLGKVMDFLSSSVGFLVVIVLPLLIFFIYQIYHLITVSMKLKRATALETAEEQAKILSASASDEETERMKAEAEKAKAEAQAALEEAKRLKAEAEAQLARAKEDGKEE
ncbi:MAG: signal peptidase I [Oscillospiraceae bacterium]|jgi:signal peptidase|nr:signal peptidase I [Oscillospiraceae bacterium]